MPGGSYPSHNLTWSQRCCAACRQVARAKCRAARRRSPMAAKGVARSQRPAPAEGPMARRSR
eukprot:1997621-Alexandrium_andersonii.AAC.1